MGRPGTRASSGGAPRRIAVALRDPGAIRIHDTPAGLTDALDERPAPR